MSKRLKVGLVAAFSAAVLGAGMTTATAAPAPAHLSRTLWLTNAPNAGMSSATVHRDIYLVAATYSWYNNICDQDDAGVCILIDHRSIALKSGQYSWDCTLDPQDGYYNQRCTLETSGAAKATYDTKFIQLSRSSHYSFGGTLQAN